jgi:hypothetical protein
MVYTPSMNARLSDVRYPTTKRKKLEVAAAANPHILRTRVNGYSHPVALVV